MGEGCAHVESGWKIRDNRTSKYSDEQFIKLRLGPDCVCVCVCVCACVHACVGVCGMCGLSNFTVIYRYAILNALMKLLLAAG